MVIVLITAAVFGLIFARSAIKSRGLDREAYTDKKLRILTYATFVGASGPGSAILNRFQAGKNLKIEVQTAGDAGLLLERLKLAQASSIPFDVVIGLDQLMLEDAKARFQWKSLAPSRERWKPEMLKWISPEFVPYDFSPLSFVYRKDKVLPPTNFTALALPQYEKQFALQDPRSSSPGLQFFHWVKAVEGDNTSDFLRKFSANVQSVAPSWSHSYGLFKKNQAAFVFTYVTSLAFHWGMEKDRNYQILSFPEGHPVQVEFAAVPADCRECDLATQFVASLTGAEAQRDIMEKNFMFPVLKDLEAGTIFAELPQLKTIETATGKDLSEWDQVFKK